MSFSQRLLVITAEDDIRLARDVLHAPHLLPHVAARLLDAEVSLALKQIPEAARDDRELILPSPWGAPFVLRRRRPFTDADNEQAAALYELAAIGVDLRASAQAGKEEEAADGGAASTVTCTGRWPG